jgi:hypothetical protein
VSFRLYYLAGVIAIAVLLSPESTKAQDGRGTGVNVVQKFEQFCLADTSGPTALSKIVEQDKSWSITTFPDDYKSEKADVKLAWLGNIDGRVFELLYLNYKSQTKYGTHCVLRSAGRERFYPYFDDFRAVTKKFGLGGKETDVPHFFRASGKLASGKRADAVLATRSPPGAPTNYTTLQIVY